METAVLTRSALLRSIILSLDKPLGPSQTAAIARQLVDNGLLTAGPDGTQGGIWAPVTELQGKFVEQLLKHLTKGEAAFRPGAAVLLGLVCFYVPARAFLSSYGEWSTALLEVVRRDSGAASRAGALRGLGDLFARVRQLLDVPGVRRDASGIGGRTLQVATPLLTDNDCQMSALAAVHSVLQALPTVARNHTASLERSLTSLMAAPTATPVARCGAAEALALLPRAAADDAAAWSTLIRKVLLSLHTALDLLLYHGGGLSALGGGGGSGVAAPDGGLGERAREQLEAVGQGVADAEGLLGAAGFVSGAGGGSAAAVVTRPDVTLTIQVTVALLQCLVHLVGRGSTSPVPVPTHAIVLLVMRMLKVDAAVLLAPGRAAPSASAQSTVLALLPDLHVSGWELLSLTARVVKSTLMPLTALVCRLLAEHLRRIKAGGAGGLAVTMSAPVRTSLYRTTTVVLRIGGFAAGRYLGADVVGMLVTELYGLSAMQQQEQSKGSAGTGGTATASIGGRAPAAAAAAAAGVSVAAAKKAKTAGDPLAGFDAAAAAAAAAAVAPVASPSDVEAQVAALEVAEALLQVYGPALSTDLRGHLDALSYHMVAVLGEAAYRIAKEPGTGAAARAADVATLRVAATRTLIASLAAPWTSRHPFFNEGLHLLSAGASGTGGVALAEVCSEGLLALEGLLRPRSSPKYTGAARAGGVSGSAAGGSTGSAQGLHLPRPRLWSMLDPVQPQLPPAAAAAVDGAAAVAGQKSTDENQVLAVPQPAAAAGDETMAATTAGEAHTMDVCPADGGNGKDCQTSSVGPSTTRPQIAAKEAATVAAAVKGKSAHGKAKRERGKWPEPGTATEPSVKGIEKRQKGVDVKAAASALDAMELDVTEQAAAAAEGAKKIEPAANPTPPSAVVAAAGPTARAAPTAPVAPAAAVFGDETEDSEGSLPEIDSGDDSGDSDDD